MIKKSLFTLLSFLFVWACLQGCSSDTDVLTADVTFFASDDVGQSGGSITVLIFKENDLEDPVAEGIIRCSPEEQIACGSGPSSTNCEDVFSANLALGTYRVIAVESKVDDIEGGVFTEDGIDGGTVIELTAEQCIVYELGVTPGFDNARIADGQWIPWMIKSTTVFDK